MGCTMVHNYVPGNLLANNSNIAYYFRYTYTVGTVSVVSLDKATILNNFFSIVVSQGYVHVFPRDACFPHTYITKTITGYKSVICACVPGKCVSTEISLNFISSPQFEP